MYRPPGRFHAAGRSWLNLIVRAWRRGRPVKALAAGLIVLPVLAAAVMTASPAVAALAPPPGLAVVPAPAREAGALALSAWGGGLVDAGTGVTVWGRDYALARPMGSITKVMTALLVIRAGDLGREIMVTKGAIRYVHKRGASSAGLIAGDVLTARQLLEAMLLPSGCDAAYLLATSYGPGRNAFIAKMNAAAQAMGLTSTHFSHYDGMPYPTEHSTYSSPSDLIRLGEQAMRLPLVRQIVAQRGYHLAAAPGHHRYRWQTTDDLLGSYRGMLGIKTGNTNAAGNCFLFEARHGRRTLVGVLLHVDPTRNGAALFTAARALLNWGFQRI
jgi:serine-type D-Ala-D-Ala carboxypeptidase (penicillin-binding protein 5/6)